MAGSNFIGTQAECEALLEKNKYFTPDIEDIRVGYECEYRLPGKNWLKLIIKENDSVYINSFIKDLKNGDLRIAYLTKEQIEAEGWKYKGKSIDIWFEKEGNFDMGSWTSYKIVCHYGVHDRKLYVYAEDVGSEYVLFAGECKDINTFRYICKLLNIK